VASPIVAVGWFGPDRQVAPPDFYTEKSRRLVEWEYEVPFSKYRTGYRQEIEGFSVSASFATTQVRGERAFDALAGRQVQGGYRPSRSSFLYRENFARHFLLGAWSICNYRTEYRQRVEAASWPGPENLWDGPSRLWRHVMEGCPPGRGMRLRTLTTRHRI
jgi:hypothetical protein